MLDFATLAPMLLDERKTPFSDPAWTFDIKYDGYRILAEVRDGACRLKSRNGTDATKWFPEICAGLSSLPGGPHILDGEACVLDEIGRADFDRLHARAKLRRFKAGADPVVFCAFDLLVHNGRDLTAKPLKARKSALRRLLANQPPSVLYVAGIDGEGEALYRQAVALKLEGIVAKRLDSPYLPGVRSPAWLKIKRPGAVPPERFKRP